MIKSLQRKLLLLFTSSVMLVVTLVFGILIQNNIDIDILYSSQCKHQIYMQLHPYIKIK